MSRLLSRNTNLELYRIIVMMLIVAHHYVVNSGLMEKMQDFPLSPQSIFFYLFGAWGKTGINCFVLITGYFMCKSSITLQKFLKLVFEVLLYNIIIYFLFLISGYEEFAYYDLLKLIPGRYVADGFVSCFLIFYLCIPFLNVLINNLDKRKHGLLILLSLFIYTIHASLPYMGVNMNYVSWFIVLYFISSYIRLYPSKYDSNSLLWLVCTFLCILLSVCSIIGILWLNENYEKDILPYRMLSDSNVILALLTAVCSFMWFKNINIPQNKYINMIGGSTFGVLLIHANSNTMRKWLWQDLLDNTGHYNNDYFWLRPIISVVFIFFVCIIIDRIRIIVIERPLLRYIKNGCKQNG